MTRVSIPPLPLWLGLAGLLPFLATLGELIGLAADRVLRHDRHPSQWQGVQE
jgi:hypothetical protein